MAGTATTGRSHLTGHAQVPCGLLGTVLGWGRSRQKGPHISSPSSPHLSGFPPAFLFQPSCHPQQHHFLSNRSFKKPQVFPATSTQSPQQQSTPRSSETLLQSSVATIPTPQYKPSPQVTPKTSSLCQAQPRSRISRAAVSLSLPTAFFLFLLEHVVHRLRDCGGVG